MAHHRMSYCRLRLVCKKRKRMAVRRKVRRHKRNRRKYAKTNRREMGNVVKLSYLWAIKLHQKGGGILCYIQIPFWKHLQVITWINFWLKLKQRLLSWVRAVLIFHSITNFIKISAWMAWKIYWNARINIYVKDTRTHPGWTWYCLCWKGAAWLQLL